MLDKAALCIVSIWIYSFVSVSESYLLFKEQKAKDLACYVLLICLVVGDLAEEIFSTQLWHEKYMGADVVYWLTVWTGNSLHQILLGSLSWWPLVSHLDNSCLPYKIIVWIADTVCKKQFECFSALCKCKICYSSDTLVHCRHKYPALTSIATTYLTLCSFITFWHQTLMNSMGALWGSAEGWRIGRNLLTHPQSIRIEGGLQHLMLSLSELLLLWHCLVLCLPCC